MEGKDNIKELFSQKLGNYEAPVNPELWANISAQVATGVSTTAATGLSVFAKVAIGIGVSAAAITTVVLLSTSGEESVSKNETPTAQVEEKTPSSTIPETKNTAKTQTQELVQRNTIEGDNELSPTPPATPIQETFTTQGTEKTPELPVIDMSPRTASSVSDKSSSEPQIVEGITYAEMTSYGAAPVNDPTAIAETTTPKVEAIKRYTNVFTPNGDRNNDYFELPSEGLIDFSVVVFNPTGDIVFESNDPNFKWDGRDLRSGEIVESGNYMYMVSAYDSEGNPYPIYERLTILR